jgi:ferredoxin
MAYVITRLCRDCKDLGCVDVCPKDCILEHRPTGGVSELPNQLFIDPDECIDCDACVHECPWEAIFPDVEVPPDFAPDVALNAIVRTRREEFHEPERVVKEAPDADAVRANRARWSTPASKGGGAAR